MRTVWKFIVPFGHVGREAPKILLPEGYKIVGCGMDPASENPALWIELDPRDSKLFGRDFLVFGTGMELPDGWEHRGTIIDGRYVWHIYEGPES